MRKWIVPVAFWALLGCVHSPQMTQTTIHYVQSSDLAVPDQGNIMRDAASGDPEAQYRLGLMHYQGTGVPKSHKKAMRIWQRAAEAGHPGAQYSLGMAFFMGQGIVNDFPQGCAWLQKAASQGHPEASREYHLRCER